MIRGPKKTVGVLMTLKMYDQISVQAKEKDRTVPAYIRQVLRCYLWHVENAPESLVDEWNIL